MFDFVMRGGLLMWPILLCSIISVTVILERFYKFYQARIKVPNISSRIKNLLKEDKPGEAIKLCESVSDPLAHILAIVVRIRKRTIEEQEKIVSRAGSNIIRELEKNLRSLAIIGNITPLLGLLGTVTGMIKAFMKIQELGGRVNASVLAGGIGEALITTAAGLTIAIPTLVAYHYFEGRVDSIGARIKDEVGMLLETEIS